MKKSVIFILTITVTMLLCTAAYASGKVSTAAKSDETLSYEENGVTYGYRDLGDYVEICGINAGNETSITIPARIDGKLVKTLNFMAYDEDFAKVKELKISGGIEEMADSIFHDCALESAELPDSITTIPSSAFADCAALEKVTLPKQLLIIGDMAFKGCEALKNIDLPDTLVTIKSKAFSYSGLTAVTIPQSVEMIGDGAFGNTRLTTAELHDGIVSIGKNAFQCDTLTEITGMSDVNLKKFYQTFDRTPFGIKYGADGDISENGFIIDSNNELTGYVGIGGDVVIPDNVEIIKEGVFKGTEITSLTIPDSVMFIAQRACVNTGIEELVIPAGVHEIEPSAFMGNLMLKKVVIEPREKKDEIVIGDRAFEGCELLTEDNISIPAENVTLTENALKGIGSAVNKPSETPVPAFDDIADSEYKNEITDLKDYGVISGYGNADFKPNDKLTRAETASIIINSMGSRVENIEYEMEKDNYSAVYSDVDKNHWAYDYINILSYNNIVSGFGDGAFHPDDKITAAQLIKIYVCITGYGAVTEAGSTWYEGYMKKAAETGLLTGIENIDPNAELTREQAAKIVHNALFEVTMYDNFGHRLVEYV